MGVSRSRRTRIKTDPELKRQLDDARGTDQDIEAVLMLRPPARKVTGESSDAKKRAYSVLDRVERDLGLSPGAINVLANLGIVIVSAKEPFVRKLLAQPEFMSAVANDAKNTGEDLRTNK